MIITHCVLLISDFFLALRGWEKSLVVENTELIYFVLVQLLIMVLKEMALLIDNECDITFPKIWERKLSK